MTPVKYVGKRPEYTDGAYGTKIHWKQGETILVPDDKAALLLKHPDVYVRGKAAGAAEAVIAKVDDKEAEESDHQDARDLIATMNKDALENYAKTHFSIDIDKRQSVDKLRMAVSGLVDQYGLK